MRRLAFQQRRGLWLLIFTLLCLFPLPARAQWHPRVRVGIYENSPKVAISADGKPEGIFVDIITVIAAKEGWELSYVPGTWNEGLDRLARGEIDLMPDVALSADRARLYTFHQESVLSSWNQIYIPRHTNIRSLPDLDRRRVAVLGGSVQQEQFEGMVAGFGLQITLVPATDYASAFRAVANGQADAVVTNRYYGVRHAEAFGLVDTAIIFSPSQLYFAAPKDANPALLSAIDRHLKLLKQDSTSAYYQSLRRWTTNESPPALPAWLRWATVAGAVVLVVTVAWIITLRRTTLRLRLSDQRQRQLLSELAVARDAAEAADRMKSAFLATMSHELRTPLNSIIGFSGILMQELPGPLNQEQAKQMTMVCSSAEHLLALINDVLDLSKIEAGQLKLLIEPFDLPSVIDRVVATVRPQASHKGLTIDVDVDPSVGTITSDQGRVQQVLLNLLSNGVKFTEKGSLRVSACLRDDQVVVSVTDTGMGIKTEDLDRLFKPFSQVDSGINRRHEGTGLGLSISKRLVELLGGVIWVKSQWGNGSTFGFDLPTHREAA